MREKFRLRTCMKNRICNQWDNWRAYGPELLLYNQLITDQTYNKIIKLAGHMYKSTFFQWWMTYLFII